MQGCCSGEIHLLYWSKKGSFFNLRINSYTFTWVESLISCGVSSCALKRTNSQNQLSGGERWIPSHLLTPLSFGPQKDFQTVFIRGVSPKKQLCQQIVCDECKKTTMLCLSWVKDCHLFLTCPHEQYNFQSGSMIISCVRRMYPDPSLR